MHQFLDTLYGNDYTVKVIQSPIQHPADRNNSLQILELCIALFMEETKLIVRKTDRRTIMTKSMIKAPLMNLVKKEPYAAYITINKGEIYIPDEIAVKSYGLDGDMTEILERLKEASEERN